MARSENTIRFTGPRLDGLPLPSRKSDGSADYISYYDQVQRGLGIRVSSEGRKSFFLRTRDGKGKPLQTRIGVWGRVTLDFARDEARRLESEVVANQFNPGTTRRTQRAEMTFGELWKLRQAALIKGGQLTTAYAEAIYWDKYFLPWADLKLSEITQGKVKKWHQDLLEMEMYHQTPTWFRKDGRGNWEAMKVPKSGPREDRREWANRAKLPNWELRKVSAGTGKLVSKPHADKLLGTLSATFGFGRGTVGEDEKPYWTGANPCEFVSKYSEGGKRTRVIEKEEAPKFFANVDKLPELWRDYFYVLLYTGARSGNVKAMKWEHLLLESQVWRIPADETKTKKEYRASLSTPAIEILKRRQQVATSDWVFPSPRSKSGHIITPDKQWATAISAARITNLTRHDLRHTLITWARENRHSAKTVGNQAGHTNVKTTDDYTHFSDEAKLAAMESAAERAAIYAKRPVKELGNPPPTRDPGRRARVQRQQDAGPKKRQGRATDTERDHQPSGKAASAARRGSAARAKSAGSPR